jgi:hypothetical protein
MKAQGRRFGWLVLVVGLLAACGGDDESVSPDVRNDASTDRGAPSPDTGGARDTSSMEASDDANEGGAASPDAPADSVPPNDATTVDASDAATPDVPLVPEASFDATVDAGADANASDATDAVSPIEAGPEPSSTEAGTDARPVDAGAETSLSEAGPDAPADAAADTASPDVAPEASTDATEASTADASLEDGGAAEDAADAAPETGGDDAEGAAPELVHWSIAASPPECSTESSNMICGESGNYQVSTSAPCPTSNSGVFLWFPAGSLPAVGQHVIKPAANLAQAFSVTGNEVAMEITRLTPTQHWWAQSGTVDVQADGNRLRYVFSGIGAFLEANHATTTTLEGRLICP